MWEEDWRHKVNGRAKQAMENNERDETKSREIVYEN